MAWIDFQFFHRGLHSTCTLISYAGSRTCWEAFSNAHKNVDGLICQEPSWDHGTKIHILLDKTKAYRIPAEKIFYPLLHRLVPHRPNQFPNAYTIALQSRRHFECLFRLFPKPSEKLCTDLHHGDCNQNKRLQVSLKNRK